MSGPKEGTGCSFGVVNHFSVVLCIIERGEQHYNCLQKSSCKAFDSKGLLVLKEKLATYLPLLHYGTFIVRFFNLGDH